RQARQGLDRQLFGAEFDQEGLHVAHSRTLSLAVPPLPLAGEGRGEGRTERKQTALPSSVLRALLPKREKGHASSSPVLLLQTGKAQLLALAVIRLRHRLGHPAHAQDVALALGDADRTARVEQVEAVAGLADLVVGR